MSEERKELYRFDDGSRVDVAFDRENTAYLQLVFVASSGEEGRARFGMCPPDFGPLRARRCEMCRFWAGGPTYVDADCRVTPPSSASGGYGIRWARTRREEWCGSWAPIPESLAPVTHDPSVPAEER